AALVPELLKLGVDVELFTVGDSSLKATKRHHLYTQGQYEHIHKPQYDSVPILAAHLLYTLNKIVRDGAFDIIHDHHNSVGPLALSFTNGNVPPTIHTLHNPRFTVSDNAGADTPDYNEMWKQLRGAEKLYFVSISKALMASAPSSFRRRMLQPIYNGI